MDMKRDKIFDQFKDVSDADLKKMFWDKQEQLIKPIIKLSKTKTTPSIERSVLLRMGFSSLEAKNIVTKVIDQELIKYGAGHVVYIVHVRAKLSIRDAGMALINDKYWDQVESWIKEGK